MKDYPFDIKISKLKSVMEQKPFNSNLQDYIRQLQAKEYQYCKTDKRHFEDFKKCLPVYMLAGTFRGRAKEDIGKVSGLLALDLDLKNLDISENEIASLLNQIKAEAALLEIIPIIIHRTVSEKGLRLIYYSSSITTENYESDIEKLATYVEDSLDIELDHKCFNLNRLWYIAYDPEAYINEKLVDISDKLSELKPLQQYDHAQESEHSTFEREMLAYLEKHCYDGNKHDALRLAAVQASSYVIEKIVSLSGARALLVDYISSIPNVKDLTQAIKAIDNGFDYGIQNHDHRKRSKGVETAKKELAKAKPKLRKEFRTANSRLEEASKLPPSRKLMDTLVFENELTIFFADTGVGKSAFIVAWADAITKGNSFLDLECELKSPIVQVIDFELSDVQFRKRYSNESGQDYKFSDRLLIDNIDLPSDGFDTEEYVEAVITSIKETVDRIKPNILVIDNISYISNQNPKEGPVAAGLLKRFRELRDEFSLTIIVIAHTPKIDTRVRLNINHLAGSKQFSNLCDAVFALGKSSTEDGLRYIKQLKIRSDINQYENKVLVCRLSKEENLLGYTKVGFEDEGKHLSRDEDPRIQEAIELVQSGESIRSTAQTLNISKSTVSRWLKKAGCKESEPLIN